MVNETTNTSYQDYIFGVVKLLKYSFQSNFFFYFDKFVCEDGSIRVSLTTTIEYTEEIMGMFRFNRYRIQCINLLFVCVCVWEKETAKNGGEERARQWKSVSHFISSNAVCAIYDFTFGYEWVFWWRCIPSSLYMIFSFLFQPLRWWIS